MSDRLLTPPEAARQLGVGLSTIYEWAACALLRFRESALERSLANTKSMAKVGNIDLRILDQDLGEAFEDLRATLRGDIVRARAALSSLLSGRVLFQPTTTEVGGKLRRTYRLEASLVIGRLMVSPDDQRVQGVHVPDGIWTSCNSPIRQVDVVVPAVKAA